MATGMLFEPLWQVEVGISASTSLRLSRSPTTIIVRGGFVVVPVGSRKTPCCMERNYNLTRWDGEPRVAIVEFMHAGFGGLGSSGSDSGSGDGMRTGLHRRRDPLVAGRGRRRPEPMQKNGVCWIRPARQTTEINHGF